MDELPSFDPELYKSLTYIKVAFCLTTVTNSTAVTILPAFLTVAMLGALYMWEAPAFWYILSQKRITKLFVLLQNRDLDTTGMLTYHKHWH